jgi:hypothetical protein
MSKESSQMLDTASSAYKYLFLLENLLRQKIHTVLFESIGKDYLTHENLCDQREKSFDQIARNRKKQDIDNRVPETISLPLIFYLELWHLGVIMDIYWTHFEKYFPNKWEIETIKARFSILSPIRNRIAHTKSIRSTDRDSIREMLDYFSRFLEYMTVEKVLAEYKTPEEISSRMIKTDILTNIRKSLLRSTGLTEDWQSELSELERVMSGQDAISDEIKKLANSLEAYNNYKGVPRGSEKMREIASKEKIVERVNSIIDKIG